LPRGWRYAVEIRNADYLKPDYFAALSRHNVAHAFNAWTRMPTISDQVAKPDVFTADFAVVRALLRRGRTYKEAVDAFDPYSETQDKDEQTRDALRAIVERALRKKQRAYMFVNTDWKEMLRTRSRPWCPNWIHDEHSRSGEPK